MKRFVFFISTIFICTFAIAQTINWHVDGNVYTTTTCNSGESITPPAPPVKNGYTFTKWIAYTPIEYLESTGTQYIDTGVAPTTQTVIKISYQFISGSNMHLGTGEPNDAKRFHINVAQTTSICATIGKPTKCYTTNVNERHTIKIDAKNNQVSMDEMPSTLSSYTFEGTNRNFYIYTRNESNSAYSKYLHRARCFYLKIYDNDVLVRDFIPVLDSNGTPCMYDKVEHKFYYNAGTGDFIAGPVISSGTNNE